MADYHIFARVFLSISLSLADANYISLAHIFSVCSYFVKYCGNRNGYEHNIQFTNPPCKFANTDKLKNNDKQNNII